MPVLRADVTFSGDEADLMVSLGHSIGGGTYVNYASQSLNHVADLATSNESVAGVKQHVELHFFPQEDVIPAGSHLWLTFAPALLRNARPGPSMVPMHDVGTITIDLDTATLELPIDTTVTPERVQPYGDP